MRLLISIFLLCGSLVAAPAIKVLIIDGQNNHDWKATTPILKKLLEESGRFTVAVATTPPKGGDMASFQPKFTGQDVVLSNYNGEPWSAATQAAFEEFVRKGGGFVSFHAADNAFPEWKEFNEMIGVGGWGNRTEKAGPYVRFRDGKIVEDATTPGPGGHHGAQHPFVVAKRNAQHPIMKGLPAEWMHVKDELYDSLRGPAKNMTVLATAFSDPATKGTGEHEPMLMVLHYGKGRVFHTTLGHGPEAMQCVGFITTLLRGTEWTHQGKVTIPVPADFPKADKTSTR
ncbi:MAG TPA: ThuA domain-containing protein [Bryobacteraceae bacterium]|nr:ThuA domain-containing protein [Bryobacteraceae bacterium]